MVLHDWIERATAIDTITDATKLRRKNLHMGTRSTTLARIKPGSFVFREAPDRKTVTAMVAFDFGLGPRGQDAAAGVTG
jgi:hypothetical protein